MSALKLKSAAETRWACVSFGEALLRFVAQLQRRAVAPDSLLLADLSAPLTEPRAVEIAPLEIIPLDPDETSGSD
jgi:hypothetical protein